MTTACFHSCLLLILLNITSRFVPLSACVRSLQRHQARSLDNNELSELDVTKLPFDTTTPDLIKARGYPLETHTYVTKDGYILVMQRIPYGKKSPPAPNKIPVLVCHGFLTTSADWVFNKFENNSLGLVLADAGYDVWLDNQRGGYFSNKHLYLNTEQTKYWNFDFHEFGVYDFTASVDYILNVTNQTSLHNIGYSMGNTKFFVAASVFPEYNEKIRLHVSLGPSTFFEHMITPAQAISPFVGIFQIIQEMTGGFPLPPQGISSMLNAIFPLLCHPSFDVFGVCRAMMFFTAGSDPDQIGKERLSHISGRAYQPVPFKVIVHGAQMMNSKRFAWYDHGPIKNWAVYNRSIPPEYDLTKVTAAVSLVRALNDNFATKPDVDRLARQLPNLVDYYVPTYKYFTHLDFAYAKDANIYVYFHVIETLKKFDAGLLKDKVIVV